MTLLDMHLLTGIDAIDQQHQKMLTRFSMLNEAVRERQSKFALREFLAFLETYADEHFREEESLMLRSGYKEYLVHKLSHDAFRTKLHALVLRYRNQGHSTPIVIETGRFATEWLTDHFYKKDAALARFLNEQKQPGSTA